MKDLGYQFKDKALLTRALTHSSKSTKNYERLEFLGDGIIGFLVGEFLFKRTPEREGKLSTLRAHFVSQAHLSEVFDYLEIEKDLLLGKSFLNQPISKSIKCDVIEALVAAVYLDSGSIDVARKCVIKWLGLKDYKSVVDDNYKTRLQELIQSSFKCKKEYKTVADGEGFISYFYMDEDEIASGFGSSKQEAEQQAAKKAIEKLFKV